jgi:KaiC/GvpD/RAD55 family RecA-like ATPase
MPSTGVTALDEILNRVGYPDKSSVLVIGPPGIGKESLCYWFAQCGLDKGDFCLYVTRLSLNEILQDEKAYGLASVPKSIVWISREGGQAKLDLRNLPELTTLITNYLSENDYRKIRIVFDCLSSILMLNSSEVAYKFVDHLIGEVKRHDATLVATLEQGMHSEQTQIAMEQLFDGFVEFSYHKSGLKIIPLFRIGKMRGMTPDQTFYEFLISHKGVHFEPIATRLNRNIPESKGAEEELHETASNENFSDKEARIVFDYLIRSFVDDYQNSRLAIDQAGWRSRVSISDVTGINRDSLYGHGGKFGSTLKELLSSGLVETRFFPGQRGRGGEVIKIRVAYEKEHVRRIVDRAGRNKSVGDPLP